MKKIYEAPELFVDEYVADTMIASSGAAAKNYNPDNNQNCWGCDAGPNQTNAVTGDLCFYTPSTDPFGVC